MWFNFRVPQSVLYVIFSVLARAGELWKLSIHTVQPCFNRGWTSFGTMADVLLSKASVIRQLKCPGLGDTVPEICYEVWNYWENFEKFLSFKITVAFIVSEVQKFTYYFYSFSCHYVPKSRSDSLWIFYLYCVAQHSCARQLYAPGCWKPWPLGSHCVMLFLEQRGLHKEPLIWKNSYCYQPQQTALNVNISPLSRDSYMWKLGFSWLQIPIWTQH
jgi:hypothetical protein